MSFSGKKHIMHFPGILELNHLVFSILGLLYSYLFTYMAGNGINVNLIVKFPLLWWKSQLQI